MWYVDLLIPLYLLTPAMAAIIDRKTKARIILTAALMCVCFILSIIPITAFPDNSVLYSVLSNIQGVLCRVPGYILGYYMGKQVMEKKSISWFVLPVCFAVFIVLSKMPLIQKVYRDWLLGIAMIPVFCALISVTEKTKIQKALKWLGERSLELYLANCILLPFLFSFSYKIGSIDLSAGNYFYYFLVVVIGFPLAELIRCASEKIRSLLHL